MADAAIVVVPLASGEQQHIRVPDVLAFEEHVATGTLMIEKDRGIVALFARGGWRAAWWDDAFIEGENA